MLKTIAFLLLRLIATVLAVTFLSFAMVAFLPGDPLARSWGPGSAIPPSRRNFAKT